MKDKRGNTRLWTFGTIALGVAALALILGTMFSMSNASPTSSAVDSDPQPANQAQSVEQAVETGSKTGSVEVTVLQGTLEVPKTLSAGSVTFKITNTGPQAHGFAISGPVETSLDSKLSAGQAETLGAKLQPGTYVAYCPVGNHQARERATFTVTR